MRKATRRPAFEDACRTVAKNLSANGTKVNVVFSGDQALTNGSTIYLPAGDHLSVMQPEDCGVLAGYVDHEAEHIASTDMDLWNSEIGVADDYRRELANAMEDMRIEKISVRKYPGSFANLSDTTKNVCEREIKAIEEVRELMPDKLANKRFILPGAVTWEGRKRAGMHADLNQRLLDMVSPEIRQQAERINDMLKSVRDGRDGTHDVWGMVKKLAEELEGEEQKRKPQPQEQEKQERTKSEDEDGDSGSRSDSDSEDEDDDNTKAKGDDDNDDDGNDDNDRNEDGDDEASGDDGSADGEDEGEDERASQKDGGKEQVTQSDSRESGEGGGRGASLNGPEDQQGETRKVDFTPVVHTNYNPATAWIPFTTENDFVVNDQTGVMVVYQDDGTAATFSLPKRVFQPGNIATYDELHGELGQHLNTMRAKLRRALMTKMERRWDGGYTSGRIDPRRLVDAVRGTPEVFRRRDPEQYMDTAVQIVVDLSSSMSYNKRIRLAAQTAIALANALEGTGVVYEVIGFQDPGCFALTSELGKTLHDAVMNRHSRPATFARYLPNMIVEFKPFERRLRDCRAALGGLASAADGANNDIDALLVAHRRLMKRNETRKVMMVLSDGKPASYSDFDERWVEQMFRKLVAQFEEEAQIQIVGIGIESDCVRKFYTQSAVIDAAEDLPRTVIDQVAQILLGSRFQIDNSKLLGAA